MVERDQSPVAGLPPPSRLAAEDASWLVRLRTASILGVVAIALVGHHVFGQPLAQLPFLGVAGVWGLTNVLASRARPPGELGVAGLLAVDAALLTAVLALSGGASNPFSFLYLVHVAIGAVVLPPRLAWSLVGLSAGLFALLFFDLPGATTGEHAHAHHDMATHLRGMWLAYVVAAGFVVTFTAHIRTVLAARDAALADAQAQAARNDHLASLATLAAGAAHELATPLSTIALVAGELERALADQGRCADLAADARLIRGEVDRCRRILETLRAGVGEPSGEAPAPTSVAALVDEALSDLDPARVELALGHVGARVVELLPRSTALALRALVRNALEASPADSTVRIGAVEDGDAVLITVADQGTGMDAATLARVGQPFFTTKPPGAGMGLGVFLARAVADRVGGALTVRSTPGVGTTATLRLPWRLP